MMEIVLYALGALALLAGVAGVVLPVLPGALLLVAGAALVGWAEGFTRVGWGTLAIVALLALASWAVDLLATVLGARLFGASRRAVLGAAVGLVVGMFLGLPGLVLGPVAGAVGFELLRNPDAKRAARAGLGAFLGLVVGSAVKVALALAAVGVVVAALVR
jgi:uncharacterized protein YqgC (DUF456 family)